MRGGQLFAKWISCQQAIKQKWAKATSGLFSALAEEEMKMRREEILRQIRATREEKGENRLGEFEKTE